MAYTDPYAPKTNYTADQLTPENYNKTLGIPTQVIDPNRALGATPQTITPSALTSTQPYNPVTPTTTPVPDISHLAPTTVTAPTVTPSVATPMESKISELLSSIQGDNTSLTGKSAYTQQQNEQLGVNATSDAITGLNSQLTGLINESKAIPLQLQQQATGQGVTAGGLQPHQTAALRNNAIQSLSVSSQIDALNGQLANAMKKVDRAVALKYGDIEERQKAKMANLELLLKDPSLTREQQDRAAQQAQNIKAQDAQIALQKQNELDTHDARIKALSNNTGNPKLNDVAIAAYNAAKSPEEVAAITQHLGLSSVSAGDQLDAKYKQAQIDKINYDLKHPKLNTQVIEGASGHTLLVNTDTGKTIKDYGAKASSVAEILSPTEAQTLGVHYGTTKSQAAGMGVTPSKPPTAAQETTALYANRLEQSGKIMDALDNYVATTNPLTYSAQSKLPDVANALKSADFQSVEQAQRNFVNATLRRESGAVISPSEFDNARKQYFPLPGDKPETVAQKKANRDLLVQGFISGSGSAYNPIAETNQLDLSGLDFKM